MRHRIKQKWRPPLALVIGGTLAAVLCMPLIGIGYFRVAGNILGWAETAWMLGLMAVIATAILGFLLWRLVLRPVYALTAHATAITQGKDDLPPLHFGTPEITALGQAVLEMGTTLQNRETGIRAYTGHVTHELKSPLTSIVAAIELLEAADDEDRAVLLGSLRTATARMQGQLEALRELAAARTPMGKGPVLLSEAAGLVDEEIAIEVLRDGLVPLAQEGLVAVLQQLAQNSAAHGASKFSLALQDGGLRISDDGNGIGEGNRSRIFEPFFTTRRAVGGTGLGLSIAQSIVQAAGSEIVHLPSETGTVFQINF